VLNEIVLQVGDSLGEHRFIGKQLAAHAGPMRALTRVDENRAGIAWAVVRTNHSLGMPTLGQRLQTADRVGTIAGTHRGELSVSFPVVIERMSDIGQPNRGACIGHPLGQRSGHRCDPLRCFARHHQCGRSPISLTQNRYRRGSLLDHRVCIGAAEPE
jgi:hypothetical protein